MFFGELIIVESGKAQAVLKIDSDDATEFPIKTYLTDDLPDDEDGVDATEVVRKSLLIVFFTLVLLITMSQSFNQDHLPLEPWSHIWAGFWVKQPKHCQRIVH